LPELVLGPVARQLTELGGRSRHRRDGPLPLVGHELRRRHGELPFTAAADHVKWFVKGADNKLRKRLRAATAAADAGDPEVNEQLYRAPKAGERRRYALELAQPLSGATGQEDDQSGASCRACSASTRTASSPPTSCAARTP
jgi:hypothetical protein